MYRAEWREDLEGQREAKGLRFEDAPKEIVDEIGVGGSVQREMKIYGLNSRSANEPLTVIVCETSAGFAALNLTYSSITIAG
jgi:hypothetical protein